MLYTSSVVLLAVLMSSTCARGLTQRSVEKRDATFCVGKAPGLYPNPVFCQMFYMCFAGRTYPYICPAGTLYSHVLRTCDWEFNVDCSSQPVTLQTTIQSITATTSKHETTTHPSTRTQTDAQQTTRMSTRAQTDGQQTTRMSTRAQTDGQQITSTSTKAQTGAQGTSRQTTKGGTSVQPTTASSMTTTGSSNSTAQCNRVVCYYTNWAQYRLGQARGLPSDVDPNLCTHIIYAFAKLIGNRLAPTASNDDPSSGDIVGNYRRVTQLKQVNSNLKVLLAVGGWNVASAPFTAMVRSTESRSEFISSTIFFLRSRGFDGLDLDWEYPANRGSPPGDKKRFSLLLKELKAAFLQEANLSGNPRLLLTAAVAAGKYVVDSGYDVPVLNSELDFINLMSYDLHGSWESRTGHNSPLYAGSWESGDQTFLNVDWAANYWVDQGASREKLVIGLPLYARTFRLWSVFDNGVGATSLGSGAAGTYTREDGFLAYYEVCMAYNSGATYNFIFDQRVPYLLNGDQWIGYDGRSSLREKVRYVRQNNYGGVMVWDTFLDDMKGHFCGQGTYPLLTAINDECVN